MLLQYVLNWQTGLMPRICLLGLYLQWTLLRVHQKLKNLKQADIIIRQNAVPAAVALYFQELMMSARNTRNKNLKQLFRIKFSQF